MRHTFLRRAVRAASAVLAACTAFSPAAVGIARSEPVQRWIQTVQAGTGAARLGNPTAVFPLDGLSAARSQGLTLEGLRETSFPDLPANDADADAVRFAAHQGLIQGYGDGTFRPDGFLTCAQTVTILRRTARLLGLDSGDSYAVRQPGASLADWTQTGISPELHTVSVNGVDLLLDDGAEVRFLNAGLEAVSTEAGTLAFSTEAGTPALSAEAGTLASSTGADGAAAVTRLADNLPAVEEKTDTQWAVDAGILSPGEDLSRLADRAAMAVYLYRFARWAGADVSCSGDLSAWTDGGTVPEASRTAMSWGMESGVFRTIVEDALAPSLPVSRGQAARLMTALIVRVPAKTFANGGTGMEYIVPYSMDGTAEAVDSGTADSAGSAGTDERPLADDALAEQAYYEEAGFAAGTPPYQSAGTFWYDTANTPEAALAAEISSRTDRGMPSSISRDRHTELQGAIDAIAQYYHAAGMQVAVIENGQLTDVFSYGWAKKNQTALTPDHKYRVASISKVVVGLAAMCLREQGVVDLDTSIGTYWNTTIRNPHHPSTPVNIRSLLTHTSSIYTTDAALTADAVRNRLSSGQGFGRGTPGSLSCWNYNNYAFGVLGMTLERAAGKTLDQVLDQALFAAMGIDASFYGGDVDRRDLVATIYQGSYVGRSVENQVSYHAGTPGSKGSCFAGGLTVSVRDLGKIAALLANDGVYEGVRLLSAESVELMEYREKVWLEGGFCQAMPLRYRMDAYGRERLYYHTGSAYGVFNGFSYDPDTGDGVVVLTSGASGAKEINGNYAVCGAVFDVIYKALAQ